MGVPTPEVVWRLNWGHIPNKCTTFSDGGYGVLTCRDIQIGDQGAYRSDKIIIQKGAKKMEISIAKQLHFPITVAKLSIPKDPSLPFPTAHLSCALPSLPVDQENSMNSLGRRKNASLASVLAKPPSV